VDDFGVTIIGKSSYFYGGRGDDLWILMKTLRVWERKFVLETRGVSKMEYVGEEKNFLN